MKEIFINGLYESVVRENKELYRNIFDNTDVDKKTTEYWKETLMFYDQLPMDHRRVLLNIIEQIMIDTVSNVLGIIDGSSTLGAGIIEPKLLLSEEDTEGELQDLFLAYVEENHQ